MTTKNFRLLLIPSIALLLTACGSSETSKAEKVINEGLGKNALCSRVPVGIPIDKSRVGEDGALGLLKSKGLITESTVYETRFMGEPIPHEGFVFTEQGKSLIQSPGRTEWPATAPCVRTGVFKVEKIEAIDYGNDIEGKPVASVRARIKFVSESWLTDTHTSTVWTKFWNNVGDIEKGQWLYRLRKSGDELYFSGNGERLK